MVYPPGYGRRRHGTAASLGSVPPGFGIMADVAVVRIVPLTQLPARGGKRNGHDRQHSAACHQEEDGARMIMVQHLSEDDGRDDPGDVEASGHEAEYLAIGAARRYRAHDQVA